jgi:hypothetical protein
MAEEQIKKQPASTGEAATVPSHPTEEDIKDGEQGEDDLIDNMPDSHPEPKPTKKS